MAVMQDADRVAVWAEWMRDNRESVSVTKTDIRAAINAADQWVSDNQGNFNSALPVASRAALNAAQKARVLMFVIQRRFLRGVS